MSRKIGIAVDEDVFCRARQEGLRQGRPTGEIVADALDAYLIRGERAIPTGVIVEGWGVLELPRGRVRRILWDDERRLGG